MIQKSYEKNKGNLYIIPTPIGNLKDITYRAVEMLKSVDAIFAEDTRITLQLLNSLNIKNRIYSCHKFNELKACNSIIKMLSEDKNVALVTDRGTPLISDPGFVVVKNVINHGFNVISLPGPSALLPALNMSGIKSDKFLFYGFLSSKEGESIKELEKLKKMNYTIVIYESPHKFLKTLKNINEVLGNRNISVSREISKMHEEIFRGKVLEAINHYIDIRGEFVIVIEPEEIFVDYEKLIDEIDNIVKKGTSSKDAVKEISKKYEVSKNMLYNMYEEKKK